MRHYEQFVNIVIWPEKSAEYQLNEYFGRDAPLHDFRDTKETATLVI